MWMWMWMSMSLEKLLRQLLLFSFKSSQRCTPARAQRLSSPIALCPASLRQGSSSCSSSSSLLGKMRPTRVTSQAAPRLT